MSYTVPVLKSVYQLSPTMLSYNALPQFHAIHYQTLPAPVVTVTENVVQEPKTVKTTVETTVVTTEVKEVKVPEVRSTCLWRHGPVNFYEIHN